MFSGLVEGQRSVTMVRAGVGGLALEISLEDLVEGVRVGDSIAVSGCCLTVSALDGDRVAFHVMGETRALTCFDRLIPGAVVNVERSLRVGDRLGGHFVSGHVDGLGVIESVAPRPDQTDLCLRVPEGIRDLVVPKGSITIDGVSLTVAVIRGAIVTVCLIPHTLRHTTLGNARAGDSVHVEADLIGKWVRRLVHPDAPTP